MDDSDHLECVFLQLYSLEQLCLECDKVIENAADHLKCLEETTEVPWVDWRS
jgi:O-acetylhomoserine/O-acetylserine sulfhydrylase-like pyridoxal-dependent enzyme